MRVRNKKRLIFTKGVELDRDMMPGETALVLPDFEQSERILAAISSGAIEITTDRPTGTVKSKNVGGMVVSLPPDADVTEEGDTYYQDHLDVKDLPPLVKAAQAEAERRAAAEEQDKEVQAGQIKPKKVVDDGLSHVVVDKHPSHTTEVESPGNVEEESLFPKDAIGSQLHTEVEEKSKLEQVQETTNEAERQVAEFARRRGGSRVKYVAQMTDLGAMREALKLVKTGKAKEALKEKIAAIIKPRPIDL